MKTKTTTFALVLMVIILMSCNDQHRLEHWNIDKITSIQVDVKQSDGIISMMLIDDQSEIKRVMDFLLRTEFEPSADESIKEISTKDKWAIRLILKGQRDQIFLYKDHAFIGKSNYLIDKDVLRDF